METFWNYKTCTYITFESRKNHISNYKILHIEKGENIHIKIHGIKVTQFLEIYNNKFL